MRTSLACLVVLACVGCTLLRDGGRARGADASAASDDAGVPSPRDAGRMLRRDASTDGGGVLDAGAPLDASAAAAALDAGCRGRERSRCNGVDDDCDGRVDEEVEDCECKLSVDDSTRHTYASCDDARDWASARERCESLGYRLVSIETPEENDVVARLVEELGRDAWIGLSDRDEEGTFVWPDGAVVRREGRDERFARWRRGEPNDFAGEDCVEMTVDGDWNDDDCDTTRDPFVCEAAAP